MGYKPKISKTENDKKENKSILFLENLFIDAPIQTRLSSNDKTANIDGYLELLDDESRLIGKITVQVKTVPARYTGKNKYPCPTSLFGYAQNTTDIVFLIAVDLSKKVAFWKHISRALLHETTEKDEQGEIILHFDDCEQLSESTLTETVDKWKNMLKTEIELFRVTPAICQENEELRQKLISYQNPVLGITSSIGVKQIQIFIDKLNYLLDNDFSYIKKLFYPNVWKRGVAVFEYTETDLSYTLYSIKYGENSLLFNVSSTNYI